MRDALAATRSRNGGLFLLAGEAGIGKTTLAAEVARDAREQGIRITWGRCWEAGGAPALWPWREALDGLGLPFPDAGTVGVGNPEEARFALFRAVSLALNHDAARAPVLVVLEDLHAADRATLLLLELLAGQLRSSGIVVIATYRDVEATLRADGGDVLTRLGRVGRVLHLARLDAGDVATLVREAVESADDRLTARVFEATDGNPLFVEEMVRAVRTRGGGGDVELEIPLGVRQIIRQRLALVPDATRGALEAAAVLGVELGAAEVARMVAGAHELLDHAVRGAIVTVTGRRYRFAHALYREALFQDLPHDRRERLHRDAATALRAQGAPIAEIAHHLLEAGAAAASEAIDHAIRAARVALDVFAFEDAIALLERARAAIPDDHASSALRIRVLTALGETRLRSGDGGGRELCVEAATLARIAGDAILLAQSALAYGAVLVSGGVDPRMVAMLEEAVAALPEEDSPLRAQVMARLAAARQPSPIRDRDIALAFAAVEMGRRVAQPRELMIVLQHACGTLYGAVHPRIRLPIARELERIASDVGDCARVLQARVRIALDLLETADFASYEQLANAYEQLASPLGPAAAPWRVPLMRSMIALARDRFDESERWQAEARRLESGRPAARRAQAYHRTGFLRAAERHAALRANIPTVRSLWLEMPYGPILADAHVASDLARIGAEDEARELLARLPDEVFAEEINAPALAEAVWIAGDAAHADVLYASLARGPDRWRPYWLDTEIVEAPGDRLLAYLAGIAGRWDVAHQHFARALTAVEAVGRRAMVARMRFEMGDLMFRAGRDVGGARLLVAAARDGAAALGLTELVALIDRRHGRSTPRQAFAMTAEGEYYAITTPRGTLRFKAVRGMSYLALLIARAGADVHVLELVGADEVDRSDAGELVDATALRAYRARLDELRAIAEDADELGNAARADAARAEMEEIAAELGRSTGRQGQPRRSASAVDRARSAVQRRIKDAIDRIADQDADLGAWLRQSVTTGNHCVFRPAP